MDAVPVIPKESVVPFRGTVMLERIVNTFLQVEKFQAQPDDVLIAAYPKAGINWMSEIVDMIYQGGDSEKCRKYPSYQRVPYLEVPIPGLPTGMEMLADMPSPRLIKTHLSAHLIPESFWKNKCKIIYMARNAKDVAVSSFFFLPSLQNFMPFGTWAEFLNTFMDGKVFYGSWYDHVIGWWEKHKNPNILYMYFEDMKEDPKREIKKVSQFLEKDLGEEVLNEIVHHTSFKIMKENPMSNLEPLSNSLIDSNISPFMRKGVVGDWKNNFTVAQNERFNEQYEKKMNGTALLLREQI